MCGLSSSRAGLARLGSRQLSSVPSREVNYLLYLKSAENSTLQPRTQGGVCVCVCDGLIVLHPCICVFVCHEFGVIRGLYNYSVHITK